MGAKRELEIPILLSGPVLDLAQVPVVVVGVEVDVEYFTIDHESRKFVHVLLEKEWDLDNVRRITLCGLGKKLKVALGNRR
jgi:hypothetical protein